MIPLALLTSLARAMSTDVATPTATHLVGTIHWRAVWRGGGRLSAVGVEGREPTVAEAMAAPTVRVDDLPWDGRRAMGAAVVRRAWRMARPRGVVGWTAVVGVA